jgi:Ca2+-binding RTX toxin-like protein
MSDGTDNIDAGDDNDTIIAGAFLTTADAINGGAGTDTLHLSGNASAPAQTGGVIVRQVAVATVYDLSTVENIENVVLATGTDAVLDSPETIDNEWAETAGRSYNITLGANTVKATETMVIDATALVSARSYATQTNLGAIVDPVAGNSRADTIEEVLTLNASAIQGSVSVMGGAGNDTIQGGNFGDILMGGSGDDSITGGALADSIEGGDGFDTINITAGNDTAKGGNGNDRLVVTNIDHIYGEASIDGGANWDGNTTGDTLVLNVGTAINDATAIIDRAFGNVYSVETLELGTTTHVVLSSNAQAAGIRNVVGDASAEKITASAMTVGLNVSTADGNDTIVTGSGADTIDGGAGDDSITSNAGADTVNAGAGTNIISTGAGNDTITLAASGTDNLDAGADSDTLCRPRQQGQGAAKAGCSRSKGGRGGCSESGAQASHC